LILGHNLFFPPQLKSLFTLIVLLHIARLEMREFFRELVLLCFSFFKGLNCFGTSFSLFSQVLLYASNFSLVIFGLFFLLSPGCKEVVEHPLHILVGRSQFHLFVLLMLLELFKILSFLFLPDWADAFPSQTCLRVGLSKTHSSLIQKIRVDLTASSELHT
jgi:hypothetical protein